MTKEKIDLIHRKGLKIMVWNITPDDYDYLTAIGVDYLQIDLE